MKLVRDHSAGARGVSVPCLFCGEMLRLADAVIDRDGPAFRAYYHDDCAPVTRSVRIVPNADCRRDGCARSHDLFRPCDCDAPRLGAPFHATDCAGRLPLP